MMIGNVPYEMIEMKSTNCRMWMWQAVKYDDTEERQ